MQAIVLASTSHYRAMLLERLKLAFTTCAPDVDESATADDTPKALSLHLARLKADSVAHRWQANALIIASDQVAICRGQRLHKPGEALRAREQLATSRGCEIDFHTAIHLLDTDTGWRFNHVDHTRAQLRDLSDEEIARYVEADQPLSCAGSFKVESLGISLFDRVDSHDPTALIGLPLIALCQGLREAGVHIP